MERRTELSIHHLWTLKQYFEDLCTQHFPREIVHYILALYYKSFKVSIYCNDYTFVILFDTEVYYWIMKDINIIPTKLNIPSTIKISCGTDHILALIQDQTMYIWGENKHGELGTNNFESINNPSPHSWHDGFNKKILSGITKIKTSGYRSIALSKLGEVYSWGDNYYDHLERPIDKPRGYYPRQMNLPSIKKISCGVWHSTVLTLSGEVYSWGSNDAGQLGNGIDSNEMIITYTPQKIYLPPVKNIICGYDFSVAIAINNEVYAWGDNRYG
jgi:alpha-tubulin suppressor-like RCC1 family protein